MSSTCSVPAATVAVNLTLPSAHPQTVSSTSDNRNKATNDSTQSSQSNGLAAISYEGRLSLLGADHPSGMDFDQTVVLRRIKAECDMLDFQSIHKDNFMGVDMSTLPLYSSGFSPNHPGNAGAAGIFSSVAGQSQSIQGSADGIKTPEYPSTPIRQPHNASALLDPAGSHGRQHQNDSGISPGSTGAAGSAAGSTNSGDEMKKRNGHSESGGEDPAAGSGVSGSPYSDHFSGDERRMLLTPTEEDDGDLMDGPEDDEDELLDEEGSSRGANSDVVGEALSRLERALMSQSGGMSTNGNLTEGSSGGAVYQCNMCSYSATSRFHFQAHLNSHFDVKCTHCDFTARTEGKLRAHIRTAHSDVTGMDDGEMGNTRVPRVTTQGKLKTHKCKHPQCGFVAVTKLDFWEHTRTHIKVEKLLTCPHCPFVTEYRHHLEYHTRNHLNSKPFKCPKCSYSCVNKSMLNSHMKSHSNVYQFRCQDCAYATKYQHSLKLHLRKYGHTSTSNLSLNDPATPGSDHGTKVKGRRSPKKPRGQKNGQNNVESPAPPTSNNSNPSGFNPPVGASPSLAIPFNFPLYPGHPLMSQPTNPVNSSEPESKKPRIAADEILKCGMCDYGTANKDHFSQHLLAHAAADQHHRELANLFGVIPADLLNSPHNPQQQQNPLSATPLKGSSTSTPHQQQYQMNYLSRMLANPTLLFSTPSTPAVQQQEWKKQPEISRPPTPDVATPPPSKPNQIPLDLSREKDDLPPTSAIVTNKHRRKGQAFKLERTVKSPSPTRQLSPAHSGTPSPSVPVPSAREPAEDEEEEDDEDEEEMEGEEPIVDTSIEKPAKKETKIRNPQCPGGEWGGAYQCSYCDIAFKDVVMYTMHMGYHGFQDPFTCNMCGQSTHDKLAFFLHIARSSHS